MGIKTWYKNQMARYEEAQSDIGGHYGVYALTQGNLAWNFQRTKRPVAGAVAVFESGREVKSPTLARVVAGGVLAGPAGAIVGGLFQKDKTKCYVTVTFADQSVIIIDGPARDERALKDFAERINAASRFYSQ